MSTNARFLAKLFRLTDEDYLDSAEVIQLVDSDYVSSRVGPVGGGTVDSDDILAIVDSDYISSKIQEIYPGDRSIDTYRYITTEGQNVFQDSDTNGNVLSYVSSNNIQVFLNGVLLDGQTDYVASNGTAITINDSLGAGEELLVQDFASKFILDISQIVDSAYVETKLPKHSATLNLESFKFSSTANQLSFTGSDQSGNVLQFDSDNIIVFVNGVNVIRNEDFTTQNGDTLTLLQPADSLDEILVINFSKYFTTALSQIDSAYVSARIPRYAAETEIKKYRFIADSNQSTFTGADKDGNVLAYDSENLQVFLNGVYLIKNDDYTASNGTSVVLSDPADSGFDLVINSFSKYYVTEALTQGLVLSSDSAPVSPTSTGEAGTVIIDSAHMYVCKSVNSWVRLNLDTNWE